MTPMNENEILTRINVVFNRLFPGVRDSVTRLTNMNDVDGWNSLNHLKLILMLEDEFNVKIKARESVSLTSVSKIMELIASKTGTAV